MARQWIDWFLGVRTPVERRKAIQVGLASAAGMLLSATESHAVRNSGKGRSVVVVGGGFAGLACAHELASVGCRVTVLEARDRVGGRAHSLVDWIPGKIVEAGGELLGANHPTVQAYAQTLGLTLNPTVDYETPSPEPTLINGRTLDRDELEAITVETDEIYDAFTNAARVVDGDCCWKTPDADKLDQISTADWIQQQKGSATAKAIVYLQFMLDNAVIPERQSLLGNLTVIHGGGLEKYWTDTEVFRCQGGNQQYAIQLAERIGAANIHLKSPVTRITVTASKVRVTDATGKQYEADDVVLAVPPSLWDRIEIEPRLPDSLAPQMGDAVKFLSMVKERFWESHGLPPTAFADDGVGSLWFGTENQIASDVRECIVSFIGGPSATMWSQLDDEQRQLQYTEKLERLQPGFAAALLEMQFVNWPKEEWTAGGYSFPAPGQIIAQGPTLREGLGRLHFAGEHTCYPFIGYMEGALNSGVSLAKRMV